MITWTTEFKFLAYKSGRTQNWSHIPGICDVIKNVGGKGQKAALDYAPKIRNVMYDGWAHPSRINSNFILVYQSLVY